MSPAGARDRWVKVKSICWYFLRLSGDFRRAKRSDRQRTRIFLARAALR